VRESGRDALEDGLDVPVVCSHDDLHDCHREGRLTLKTRELQPITVPPIDADMVRETREALNMSRHVCRAAKSNGHPQYPSRHASLIARRGADPSSQAAARFYSSRVRTVRRSRPGANGGLTIVSINLFSSNSTL
jgi:hypothetical protein